MNDSMALNVVNEIFRNVFGVNNPYSLDQLLEKFAFDIKLPKQVNDSTTNEITWADAVNSGRFITQANMRKRDKIDGWMLPKRHFSNLQELLNIWRTVNLTATERVDDSENVSKSDTIYSCINVYRSSDSRGCKNIIYCDSCGSCEYTLASQRSATCAYCIRVDDSKDCSNSYNVQYSNKVINSYFIQDCFNLYECMFCSHIANKRYCIANMQFEENEYFAIKKVIIQWIMQS